MLDGCAGASVRPPRTGEPGMSGTVARITHISARSDTSFEDAVRIGVERAASTLRNVSGAWVKEQKVDIVDGRITTWQVVLEITFVLE
jgi:flavin-binding protein dodecin